MGTALRDPHAASGIGAPRRLLLIVLCGFAVRLALLPFDGYPPDMGEFIRWANLASHVDLHGLYTFPDPVSGHVVNYPPTYALILEAIARIYQALHLADPDHRVLVMVLKIPAILADLVLCVVTFLIVNRWFSQARALVAALLAALSPSTWLISSYWGQVDSLAAAFVALALLAMVRKQYVAAWIALTLGVLIKPQPVVIAPLLLIWQLKEERFSPRVVLGPVATLVMTYLLSVPFAPSPAPLSVFAWVANLLRVGVDLYPDSSVGAFNVYTIVGWFHQSDAMPVLGVSLRTWGNAAFGALVALVALALAARITREREQYAREQILLLACFIVLAGMFLVLTRMHERYLFFAVAFAPALWYLGRWERSIAVTMMATFTLNCVWILWTVSHPGAAGSGHAVGNTVGNAASHLRTIVLLVGHCISFVNVLAFGALVYHFLRPNLRLQSRRTELPAR